MPSSLEEAGPNGTWTIAPIFTVRIQAVTSFQGDDESRMEIDNHTDASVVGKNCLVIHDHECPVQVTGYDLKDGSKQFRTVDATVAYDHP